MLNIGGAENQVDMNVCTSAEPFHKIEDAFHGDDHVDIFYRKYHDADMIGRANSNFIFISISLNN